MYRLGQKVKYYDKVKVEYYAPYLLKEGMVQKILVYKGPFDPESGEQMPPVEHVMEKFRYRTDKMSERETLPDESKIVGEVLAGKGGQAQEPRIFHTREQSGQGIRLKFLQ